MKKTTNRSPTFDGFLSAKRLLTKPFLRPRVPPRSTVVLVRRIIAPEYPLIQGAYRLGKWKFIFNEYCQGYYTFDRQVQATVRLSLLLGMIDTLLAVVAGAIGVTAVAGAIDVAC